MIRTRLGVLMACALAFPALVAGSALVSRAADEKIGTVIAPPIKPVVVVPGKPARLPFAVYADSVTKAPYVVSGWMGNAKYFDQNLKSTENPHSGKTCIKISYTEPTQFGGVAWLDPASDWGDKAGGYNLTGAKNLLIWARGAQGGEKVTFGYGLLGAEKKFHDSSGSKIDVELTKDWKPYVIPLADKDLRCIKSGFYWQYNAKDIGKPATFFIDDVEYIAVDVPASLLAGTAKPEGPKFPFVIYDDYAATPSYAPTGRIGPIGAVVMNLKCAEDPHGGKTCIKAEFTAKAGRGGAIWVDPPNDMGDRPGGQNLKGAGAISFWARGAQGGEKVSFGYGYIGTEKKYFDSSTDMLRNAELTTEWKEYTIPLVDKDLTQIKSAFYWLTEAQEKPVVFYLDDIQYTAAPKPPPTASAPSGPYVGTAAAPQANPAVKIAALPLPVSGEGGEGAYEPTGWLGDSKAITLEMKSDENPHSGKTCIRVDFRGAAGNLSGIVWQNPRNNWGTLPGGYNLSGAHNLTFWARGAQGGERLNFGYGMVGKEKPYPDSSTATLRGITLGKDWQQYSIGLVGRNLSCIISGFYWTAVDMEKPITFFLDDIEYSAADAK